MSHYAAGVHHALTLVCCIGTTTVCVKGMGFSVPWLQQFHARLVRQRASFTSEADVLTGCSEFSVEPAPCCPPTSAHQPSLVRLASPHEGCPKAACKVCRNAVRMFVGRIDFAALCVVVHDDACHLHQYAARRGKDEGFCVCCRGILLLF